MRVLLVDKRVIFLESLQRLLQANGILVVGTASESFEALEKIRTLFPDVIIIDVTGNGHERLETIKQIKLEKKTIKIIVLADSEENMRAVGHSNTCSYLLTSIKGKDLMQKLKALELNEERIDQRL